MAPHVALARDSFYYVSTSIILSTWTWAQAHCLASSIKSEYCAFFTQFWMICL